MGRNVEILLAAASSYVSGQTYTVKPLINLTVVGSVGDRDRVRAMPTDIDDGYTLPDDYTRRPYPRCQILKLRGNARVMHSRSIRRPAHEGTGGL